MKLRHNSVKASAEAVPPSWSLVDTVWGIVAMAGDESALSFVGYPQATEDAAVAELNTRFGSLGVFDDVGLARFAEPITGYFTGLPLNWSEIPVRLSGTSFQQLVWRTTREIPYGQTSTYAELARACGKPLAPRAVGTALGRNPAGLLVPCHRVIAAGGVGGYGGWKERKLALLRLEGIEVTA